MSDSIFHKLFLLLEATYGTTPAVDPEFTRVRHTECDLDLTRPSTNSAEITGDGHIRNARLGQRNVAGGFGFELTYGDVFENLLQALLGGTWANDELKVAKLRRSFSLLRHFSDQASGDKPYHLFNGCEVNSLELTVPAEGVVTGSFGFVGRDRQILADLSSLTDDGGPTFTDPTTLDAFDSFTGSINEDGNASGIITELSLTYNRGLAPRLTVGSGGKTILPSEGQKSVTATVTVFFENAALIEKYIEEKESSIGLNLQDPLGNKYGLAVPRLKYTGAPVPTAAQGPLTLALPFQGFFDEGEESPLVVTREPFTP